MKELVGNISISLAFGINIGLYTSNFFAGIAAFLGMCVITTGLHEIARAIVWTTKDVSPKTDDKTE